MSNATTTTNTTAKIAGIYTCPHGGSVPMRRVETATLIAGRGLKGDRYCHNRGTYSCLPEAGRQLTLISAGVVLEHDYLFKKQQRGTDNSNNNNNFDIGQLRRNLVIRGLSPAELRAAIGHVVNIGDDSAGECGSCQLLVHRNCVPCPYNERLNKLTGLQDALWLDMGVSCEILRGGTIRTGDAVTILKEETRPVQDDHPAAFYVPPQQRTAEMIRTAIESKRALHRRLRLQDPEGAARLEASYQQVGLSFWPRDKD